MKVLFNCSQFLFHTDFVKSIRDDLVKRGDTAIIVDYQKYPYRRAKDIEKNAIKDHGDADFTIVLDEESKVLAGIGVYINHAIPIVPQNAFYYEDDFVNRVSNFDHLFFCSDQVANMYIDEMGITHNKVSIVGLPKLDQVFINRKEKQFDKNNLMIAYAPTGKWKKTLNSEHIIHLDRLKKYGTVVQCGHPADDLKNISSLEMLSRADIIISDYSSIGLEAIILNIPTIFVDSTYWNNHAKTYNSRLICETAREATIRVKNMNEVCRAIETFINNPNYLKNEREYYGAMLAEYHGTASIKFVDELYKIKYR